MTKKSQNRKNATLTLKKLIYVEVDPYVFYERYCNFIVGTCNGIPRMYYVHEEEGG